MYRVDLAEWYAAGRWVALLELIDGLPTASRYNDAMVNDPDIAGELAKLPEPTEKWAPHVSEMDLHAVQLADLIDAVKHLTTVFTAANSKTKPPAAKPYPRPRTALQKAQQDQANEWAVDFVELFGFTADDI